MKIEINDDLYCLFVKMVEFMQADGQPVNEKTVVGWIEHGAEMFAVEYMNNCEDVWNWNEQFRQFKTAYDKYKSTESEHRNSK